MFFHNFRKDRGIINGMGRATSAERAMYYIGVPKCRGEKSALYIDGA